jgi:hypothetical protein
MLRSGWYYCYETMLIHRAHSFPAQNTAAYWKMPYSIWDFVPASYSCPYEMERIGRMGDGGKWVCGMSHYEQIPEEKPCVIYSFGVQFESSFGMSMTPFYTKFSYSCPLLKLPSHVHVGRHVASCIEVNDRANDE